MRRIKKNNKGIKASGFIPPGQLPTKEPSSAGPENLYFLELIHTIHTLGQLKSTEEILAVEQVVMAGRSNVGKSSLINCLAGRKGLAKVSASPGKTRSINLYQVRGQELMLADLPGYGYARYAMTERRAWAKLIETYFSIAKVKFVSLLVDCRLPPQNMDLEMLGFVHGNNMELVVVITKTDKCSKNEVAVRRQEWHDLSGGRLIIPFSSRTGAGRAQLWQRMVGSADTLN